MPLSHLPSAEEMRRWRRQLHAAPGFGFEVEETARFVADRLAAFGVETHDGIGRTGVVGVLRKGRGRRRIGLRADMDALQIQERNAVPHASAKAGLMHACGHDGHTTMLLAAASALAQMDGLDATVSFIFQPAEEHGRGAAAMIADGLFERFEIDEIYALHNLPGLPVGTFATRPGPIMACEDNFEITLEGLGGHAARPHHTNDALVAGCQLVLALQTIVARRVDPLQSAVVSATELTTDGTRNALPGRCVISGDTRSYDPATQILVETEIRRLSAGVAAAYGMTCEVAYTHEFAATVNTLAESALACVAASTVPGLTVLAACEPLMASDDFGVMLRHRPGNYAFLGNGLPGDPGGQPLHSPYYDFNDAALALGAGYFVALASGPPQPHRAAEAYP
jgi:amidohydrolase